MKSTLAMFGCTYLVRFRVLMVTVLVLVRFGGVATATVGVSLHRCEGEEN